MIHPSYVELMDVVNKSGQTGEAPVVNSRYSIVAATAKRARQLIDGGDIYIDGQEGKKPLSIAVNELYSGELKILTEEEAATKDLELIEFRQREAARLQREAEEAEKAKLLELSENEDSEESEEVIED